MRIVGDGDSSVFAKIMEEVPVLGRDVQKKVSAKPILQMF